MPSKKTASKKNKKKLDFWHQPLSPKIFWPLLGVLFLFFIISIINFWSLWQLRSGLKIILTKAQNNQVLVNDNNALDVEDAINLNSEAINYQIFNVAPLNNDTLNSTINLDSLEIEAKNNLGFNRNSAR